MARKSWERRKGKDFTYQNEVFYTDGRYEFLRKDKGAYQCVSGGSSRDISANYSYEFTPNDLVLAGGRWIILEFEGKLLSRAGETCVGSIKERYIIRGELAPEEG